MIGKLTGVVDSVTEDHLILDVSGVGYLLSCPQSTLSKLSAGQNASVMVETRINDETIKLYGFFSAEEREWFRLLQTVQNVGARVALSILSTLTPRDLEKALALGDKATIGRAKGVGPKVALRIVTELKDKAPAMMLRGHGDDTAVTAPHGPEADALNALTGLGYSPSQASEAVARAARGLHDQKGGAVTVETLIREALRQMAK